MWAQSDMLVGCRRRGGYREDFPEGEVAGVRSFAIASRSAMARIVASVPVSGRPVRHCGLKIQNQINALHQVMQQLLLSQFFSAPTGVNAVF